MRKKLRICQMFIILASALLLLSCEKDLYEDQLLQENRKFDLLSGQAAENAVDNLFDQIQNHNRLANRGGDDEYGRVRYDIVMRTIDSVGNVTYTFKDEHPNATDSKFYNMVLQEKVDGEKMVKLFEYQMTPEFAEKYNNGEKSINEFEGTYNYRLVAWVPKDTRWGNPDGDEGGSSGSSSGTNDGNTGTPTGNPHTPPTSNPGSNGNNNSAGVGSIGVGNTTSPCPTGGGDIGSAGPGSDGGSSSGGSSTTSTTTSTCTVTTITVLCNGGGGHTGQSSCNGTNHGYMIQITVCTGGSNRSAEDADPCSSSGNTGVGVLPPEIQRQPCEEMTRKSEETVFHNKLMALNTPANFTANNEVGFYETRAQGTGLVNYTNAPINPNTHSLSNVPPSLGFAHTHTDFYIDPDGQVKTTIRMFSPMDLYTFVTTCQSYASNNGLSASDTYGVMASSNGVFAIKLLTPYFNLDRSILQQLNNLYNKKAQKLMDDDNLNANSAKKLFLEVLKKTGIDNVGLFRATNTELTRWSRVTLDDNGNLIEIPCN